MKADQKDHNYCDMTDSYSKYRRVVAEWMIDVCHYFNLHPTTTHAAIAYLDRLQPNEKFSRFEWQMLAIACILISCKRQFNKSLLVLFGVKKVSFFAVCYSQVQRVRR
jgi:hypothetical protein